MHKVEKQDKTGFRPNLKHKPNSVEFSREKEQGLFRERADSKTEAKYIKYEPRSAFSPRELITKKYRRRLLY